MLFFRIICFTVLLSLTAGLFWLGRQPDWVSLLPVNPPEDKLVHFGVFAFIAALLRFAIPGASSCIIFAVAAMIGAADELHQYFVPGRTASLADFTADLAGVIFAVILLKRGRLKPFKSDLDPEP